MKTTAQRILATAALAAPLFFGGCKTTEIEAEEINASTQTTGLEGSGVFPRRGYVTVGGTTDGKLHTGQAQAAVNATHKTSLKNIPVVLDARASLFDQHGKTDALTASEGAGVSAGYDTQDDLSKEIRLTGLGRVGIDYAHRLSGDPEVRDALSLNLGGQGVLQFNSGSLYGRVQLGAGYRLPISGELQLRDSFGDRVELRASGPYASGSFTLAGPITDDKKLGWIGRVSGSLDSLAREATGSTPAGDRRVELTRRQGTAAIELGLYTTDLGPFDYAQATVTGSYERADDVTRRDAVLGPGSSAREEDAWFGLRLYGAVSRFFFGASGEVGKDGKSRFSTGIGLRF